MGNSVQCIKITADILRPIVGKTSHHIKKYGRNKMDSVMIKQDDMFVSHDAMSLITNTLTVCYQEATREIHRSETTDKHKCGCTKRGWNSETPGVPSYTNHAVSEY